MQSRPTTKTLVKRRFNQDKHNSGDKNVLKPRHVHLKFPKFPDPVKIGATEVGKAPDLEEISTTKVGDKPVPV